MPSSVLAAVLMFMAIIVTVLGFLWWVFNLGVKLVGGEDRAKRMRGWVHEHLIH